MLQVSYRPAVDNSASLIDSTAQIPGGGGNESPITLLDIHEHIATSSTHCHLARRRHLQQALTIIAKIANGRRSSWGDNSAGRIHSKRKNTSSITREQELTCPVIGIGNSHQLAQTRLKFLGNGIAIALRQGGVASLNHLFPDIMQVLDKRRQLAIHQTQLTLGLTLINHKLRIDITGLRYH